MKQVSQLSVSEFKIINLKIIKNNYDETIIRDNIVDFLIKHKLINPSQRGFLKAGSWIEGFELEFNIEWVPQDLY